MRKNLASVVILGATAALSLSVVSPALAASYPPVTNPIFNTSELIIGTVKASQKVILVVNSPKLSVVASLAKPVELTIGGFKKGEKVTSSVVIDGKKVALPTLIVNSKGAVDTKALGFTKPGKYVITYKSAGVTKTLTVTVKG